jgi:hypothetical protein
MWIAVKKPHHITVNYKWEINEWVEKLQLRLAIRKPSGMPPATILLRVNFALFVDKLFA